MTLPNADRRTVLRTVTWGVPAVALASASPAFAASPTYDLVASISGPSAPAPAAGSPQYSGPETLEFSITLTNNGTGTVPAGSVMTVALAANRAWSNLVFKNPDSFPAFSAPTRSGEDLRVSEDGTDEDTPGTVNVGRAVFTFAVNRSFAPGASVTIPISVLLRGQLLPANGYAAPPQNLNMRARVRWTSTDVSERNTANNTGWTRFFTAQLAGLPVASS